MVLLKASFTRSEKEWLWAIYKRAFSADPSETAQEQLCYTRSTFFRSLLDRDYRKFVCVDRTGTIRAFAFLTNNLKKARVAYMRPERFVLMAPNFRGRIFYMTTICVDPEVNGRGYAVEILADVLMFLDRRNAIGAFDYASEKIQSWQPLLDRIVSRLRAKGQITREAWQYRIVGRQEYAIYG